MIPMAFPRFILTLSALVSFTPTVYGISLASPEILFKRQGACLSRSSPVAGGGSVGYWNIPITRLGNHPVTPPNSGREEVIAVVSVISPGTNPTITFGGATTMPRNRAWFMVPPNYMREHGVPEGSPNIIEVRRGTTCGPIEYDYPGAEYDVATFELIVIDY